MTRRIADGTVLRLIRRWLTCEVEERAELTFLGFALRYDRDRFGRPRRYLNIVPSDKAQKAIRANAFGACSGIAASAAASPCGQAKACTRDSSGMVWSTCRRGTAKTLWLRDCR